MLKIVEGYKIFWKGVINHMKKLIIRTKTFKNSKLSMLKSRTSNLKQESFLMLLALILLTTIASSIGAGTYAKYVYSKTSSNNVIKAASFGVLLPDKVQLDPGRFSLDRFSPFSEPVEFLIDINKKKMSVDVKYTLAIKIDDNNKALFEGKTPIKMELMRKVDDKYEMVSKDFLNNPYELIDLYSDNKANQSEIEEFKVRCSWNSRSSMNDIKYSGLTGKFDVVLTAEQKIN